MKTIFIIIAIFIGINAVFSQGCNDAGVCTFGYAGAGEDKGNPPNSLILSQYFGLGEQNTSIITTKLEVSFELMNKVTTRISTPYSILTGSLGTVAGLGDITLSLNREIRLNENAKIHLSLGGKIPSNNANRLIDYKPLPMVYQTSLGTYDLVTSLNYFYKNWHFAMGYQHPFGSNQNEFLHETWPLNSPAQDHFESAALKRGDDLMFRAERIFDVKTNKLFFGILPIYRITPDQIDINGYQDVKGTTGLTLNLNAGYNLSLKHNSSLTFLLAAPAITRDVRTDGLTRTFLFSLSYLYPILPLPAGNDIPKSIFKLEK